jgi:hypothetical protein
MTRSEAAYQGTDFPRFANNAAFGVPSSDLFVGEWWIAPQFGTGSKTQIKDFADAQKLRYSTGAGWFFWNFKIEAGTDVWNDGDLLQGVLRDYVQSVKAGYLPRDPKKLWNSKVCDQWVVNKVRRVIPRRS